jgi:hypothetical protein
VRGDVDRRVERESVAPCTPAFGTARPTVRVRIRGSPNPLGSASRICDREALFRHVADSHKLN